MEYFEFLALSEWNYIRSVVNVCIKNYIFYTVSAVTICSKIARSKYHLIILLVYKSYGECNNSTRLLHFQEVSQKFVPSITVMTLVQLEISGVSQLFFYSRRIYESLKCKTYHSEARPVTLYGSEC